MLRLQKNEISSFPLTETKSKLTSDLTEFSLSQAQTEMHSKYTEMHSKSKPTSDLTELSLSQTQKYYWDAPKHFSELVVLTCQVCLSSKSSFCFLGIFLQSELCNRLCQTTWRILWSHLGDKEGNERLCWCRIFQDNKTVYILNVSAKTNQGLDWLNTMSPHFLNYYMVIFELKTK